jgi:signal transduction histidine kinase
MHDTLLQGFTGVTMQLKAMAKEARSRDVLLATHLEEIFEEGTAAVREARRAVGDMRAGPPKDCPLTEQLAQLVRTKRERHPGTDIEFTSEGESRHIGASVCEGLFRIARECLRNTIKHSGANKATLHLKYSERAICLIASDNGRGFSMEEVTEQEGHWGLIGIRERTDLLGGKCEVVTNSGEGVRITVELPIVE